MEQVGLVYGSLGAVLEGEDNYTSIYVMSEEEYIKITSIYPFKDETLEQVG